MMTGDNIQSMHTGPYSTWDFFPANLSPAEAANPMLVIKDFFSADSLPGHLKALLEWRTFVLEERHYTDQHNNPANLLYTHKLNIRLIEAAHLLLKVNSESAVKNEPSALKDIAAHLNEAEINDPCIVIRNVFGLYNLPQYRALLYEWLETALSTNAAGEFLSPAEVIAVYENLQKLYCAAWLIHQNNTSCSIPNAIEYFGGLNTFLPVPGLYDLHTTINLEQQELIGKIFAIIKHKIDSVQAIIYLGVTPVGPSGTDFLLMLTSDSENRQSQSLSSMVEESCRSLANIIALVHHSSQMLNAANDGDMFFNRALGCPVIFLSGNLLLPKPKLPALLNSNQLARLNWERWQKQGKHFLSGADYYLKNEAYGAALFSLHQCAECMLIAVIRAVSGYRTNAHNLSRLLSLTRMFTDDLYRLFELENEESLKLFNLLKDAYINVRYRDSFFEPGTEEVIALYPVIKELVAITEGIYEKHLAQSIL